MIGPIKAVLALSASGLLVAQVIPSSGTVIDSAGRLTLDAALVLAVIALWKALGQKDIRIAEKDVQIVSMAQKVTETMVSVMEAVKELRTTVASLKLSFDDLPCSIREEDRDRHRR